MNLDISFKNVDKKSFKSIKKDIKRQMKKGLKAHLKYFNDSVIRPHATVEHTKSGYSVTLHLYLPPKKILIAKESADNVHSAIENAIKDLSRQAERHIAKISGRESWKHKQRRKRIKQYQVDLPSLSEKAQKDVDHVFESLLPKLERYIRHELTYLQSNGDLPSSYPTLEDIRDEALLKVQFKWNELTKTNDELYQALIKAVHEVLTEEIIQSQLHADDISLESEVPEDAMQQAEDMVGEDMFEFYQPFEHYHLEDIIPDKSAEIPDELLAQHAPEISYQIMANLPNDWRRILLLSYRENMTIENIAKTIMPMALTDAQQLLNFSEQFMLARLGERVVGTINKSLLRKLLE
jgi:ribosome-associated translation inhibitor RaiA/DNA-directed RNA polymerase specialized sigma24 family protein